MGSTPIEKNLLLEEQISSFKTRPSLEGFYCSGKQTECHKSCLPLEKRAEKYGSIHLKDYDIVV